MILYWKEANNLFFFLRSGSNKSSVLILKLSKHPNVRFESDGCEGSSGSTLWSHMEVFYFLISSPSYDTLPHFLCPPAALLQSSHFLFLPPPPPPAPLATPGRSCRLCDCWSSQRGQIKYFSSIVRGFPLGPRRYDDWGWRTDGAGGFEVCNRQRWLW